VTRPEFERIARRRISEEFAGREAVFTYEPAPGGRVRAHAATTDGDFRWAGGGTSELLAMNRCLASIPCAVKLRCRTCEG